MIDKGLAKYKIDRFGKKRIQGVHKGAWVNLPIKDMVVRYKAVLNGILNYYSFVDNRSRLNVIYWILLFGLAKTIANKKKMKSMKRVFKKYGKELQFLPESVPFDRPNLDRKPKRFLHKMFHEKPRFFEHFKWGVRTRAVFFAGCVICGETENVEMHHIKHVKKIKAKGLSKQMVAINRKQIPVCFACHRKIHNGDYDGVPLKSLVERKITKL
jgi:hypothetical protein